jgi:hypothetical protein
MNYRIAHGKMFKWILLTTTALIAMRVYYVQELIVAFLIFSVLFACIACVVLILFLLDQAYQMVLARAEMYVSAYGRAVRRGWERAERIAVRRSFQFGRSGEQPLPRTITSTGR